MALGAEHSKVLRMVLRESLTIVAIGALAGIPIALALIKYVKSLLFGVKPLDPGAISAASLVLFTVTALAALLPALRATRVVPMEALRQE